MDEPSDAFWVLVRDIHWEEQTILGVYTEKQAAITAAQPFIDEETATDVTYFVQWWRGNQKGLKELVGPHWVKCKSCHGTGIISTLAEDLDCSKCDGQGVVK